MQPVPSSMIQTPLRVCVETERKRIETAYNKLGIREPFVAAVMSKIKREVIDDPMVPTAATNGKWCRYNPNFTVTCTDPQLFGLVLHESLHVIFMHMWRRGDRHPGLWNYANDGIINLYIRNRGYELPEGGVHIKWVTEDMDSEYVYKRCKDETPPPPPQPQGGEGDDEGDGDSEGEGSDGAGDDEGNGSGGSDADPADNDDATSGSGGAGHTPGGDGSDGLPKGGWNDSGDLLDAEDEATKADLEATIIAAATMAKQCGQGSALIDRIIEEVGRSNVNWADATREMLNSIALSDYSWKRAHRRYVWQNVFMPSRYDESLGGLGIGFDVSGSMSQEEANQVAAEITAIFRELNPEFVEVIYCDTAITKIERFEQGDEVRLKVVGGGGTDFTPVFDYLESSEEDYAGLIYFTDMCARFDHLRDPGIPMLWANTDPRNRNHDVPFGAVVNVEL